MALSSYICLGKFFDKNGHTAGFPLFLNLDISGKRMLQNILSVLHLFCSDSKNKPLPRSLFIFKRTKQAKDGMDDKDINHCVKCLIKKLYSYACI